MSTENKINIDIECQPLIHWVNRNVLPLSNCHSVLMSLIVSLQEKRDREQKEKLKNRLHLFTHFFIDGLRSFQLNFMANLINNNFYYENFLSRHKLGVHIDFCAISKALGLSHYIEYLVVKKYNSRI